jgi:hypothetical protein
MKGEKSEKNSHFYGHIKKPSIAAFSFELFSYVTVVIIVLRMWYTNEYHQI